ncbi:MAG TPA: hypothetical protein VFL57_03790 [Bryobacteraceae bacterium]|nr:hypothetical protein [Bryobacteraceae bacterium]
MLLASADLGAAESLVREIQVLGCDLRIASTLTEFERSLFSADAPAVVISEPGIRDADWRLLLKVTQRLRQPPAFVLAAESHNPSLWAELLDLGGYDLLPAPRTPEAVRRVVASAASRWTRAREVARARELNELNFRRSGAA